MKSKSKKLPVSRAFSELLVAHSQASEPSNESATWLDTLVRTQFFMLGN